MGQVFSSKGTSPDKTYVNAINNFKTPENKTDLLRVLGMAKFLARFVPNMSKITAPLRHLTRQDVTWSWSREHDEALNNLRKLITQAPVLQYFDPNKEVTIQCDASKDGLGACLLQNNHPIGFVSRSLTKSEQMYSQIEKELLAISFAVAKFHYYIYGREVSVQSDHKPLEAIFKKNLNNVSPRLQRLLLKLAGYDLNVCFTPGSQLHIADFLSRAPITENVLVSGNTDVKVVHSLASQAPVSDAKKEEFRKATENDSILKEVKHYVLNHWPEFGKLPPHLKHYYRLKQNIKVDEGLLFLNKKIIVPNSLKHSMLHLIHEGHLGINKCKRRARECLYWKGMASDIEHYIKECHACAKFSCANAKEPLMSHKQPSRAWQRIACDIFSFRNKDYLAVIDAFSNWVELALLPSKEAHNVIIVLKSIFSRFGIPQILQADNMPFNSNTFLEFAKEWDFQTVFSSPRYPQSNGLAEKGVGICKSLLKRCSETKTDISVALMNYRNTTLKDMGHSPAQLLLNKSIKTKMPCTNSILKPKLNNKVSIKDMQSKKLDTQKFYYDRHAKPLSDLNVNDKVYLFDCDSHTWLPAVVKSICKEPRSYIVETNEGSLLRRNRKFLKERKEEGGNPSYCYTGIAAYESPVNYHFDDNYINNSCVHNSVNPTSSASDHAPSTVGSYVDPINRAENDVVNSSFNEETLPAPSSSVAGNVSTGRLRDRLKIKLPSRYRDCVN